MNGGKRSYICPVCGFTGLTVPPYDELDCPSYEICPCCGTEFGYDDASLTHAELRKRWIQDGMKWYSRHSGPPRGWNAQQQLNKAKMVD